MTISVRPNPDGSVTVSCGTDSVVVFGPAPTEEPSWPTPIIDPTIPLPPSRFPTVTPTSGASAYAFDKMPTFKLPNPFTDSSELLKTLGQLKVADEIGGDATATDSVGLEFDWAGDEVLDFARLWESLTDREHLRTLVCNVHIRKLT